MAKSQKGGEFEREFSKLFSLYVTEGKRTDVFWRSSQSGGRATVRAKSGQKTEGSYGDITCLDGDFAYVTQALCFELKRGYNGSSIQDLVDSAKKEPEFIAFWKQCERDKTVGGRLFCFVVVKRDRKKTVLLIDRSFQNKISQKVGARLYNRIDIDFQGLRLSMITLQDFLDAVPAYAFLEILQDSLIEKACG